MSEAAVSRPGPETSLTKELQQTICGYVNAGASIPHAAEAAGIRWDVCKRWIAKGRKGMEPYATFVDELARARARSRVATRLTIVSAAKKGDWRAAAYLEQQLQPVRTRGDAAAVAPPPAQDLLEERTVLVYPVPVPEGASLADFRLPEGHVVETTGEDVTGSITTVAFEDLDHDQ